jgi:valyl-tRNA synthetase
MDKLFDPQSYEARWQRHWAERGYFVAEAPSRREPYCIMIPPPNVTGKLHMGHALQSTLQDLLTRWRRMQGRNALWLPGTDHAGIATQLMVERELAAEGIQRCALGRARFLERMWEWTERHHGNIRRQLDRLGASCDWTRERFTLDEGLSRAVVEAFVRLHQEGRIYRGDYLVNWSPGLDTAISDLEVEMRQVEGTLWHIAYPVEGSTERIVVATTRPETMLGDTAIAYHPDDPRYRHLAGRRALVPVAGRAIPFVADAAVEREFGTGLVKVTPAHDAFDFELGRRHELPAIQVIDRHARMTEAAGAAFAGLDVELARARLVERLSDEGFLVREERYVHNVGFCQRSGTRVQPLISTQWFCDVSEMARGALAALRDGRLELVPASWGKTWEHWLSGIRPWCVSRQLWWGHQIPAWYDEAGNCFVARSAEEAARAAGTDRLRRDEDVLDTWFSSALWPFSTLGWPERTEDLATFYPTQTLVTGFDILFFWVARMVMAGLHFTGEAPFARVHLTGLVRDAEGQKMSKTKGNVLDPEELIDRYGADAVRFTLALLDAPGRDIPLDADRMAGYRAFGNKIWNATRFAMGKVGPEARIRADLPFEQLDLPERWILWRLSETAGEVDGYLEGFRFDQACGALYQFFWSDFCDWYIEMAKPGLEAESARPQVGDVLLTVLDCALRLLHPVMPFLTEELWQRLPGHEAIHPETICLAPYPGTVAGWSLTEKEKDHLRALTEMVLAVRNERAELKAAPRLPATLHVRDLKGNPDLLDFLTAAATQPLLWSLCSVTGVTVEPAPREAVNKHAIQGLELTLVFATVQRTVDREKAAGELAEVEAALERARARLESPAFLAKAPEKVVEGARRSVEDLVAKRDSLVRSLESAEAR